MAINTVETLENAGKLIAGDTDACVFDLNDPLSGLGFPAESDCPAKLAEVPFDSFSTMPLMIYNWASQAKMEHQQLAAAGIVVLLAVLLLMNTVAIILRQRFQKHIRW